MSSTPDDGGDLQMLMGDAQLRRLARLLLNNEEPLIANIITSQNDRVLYLRSVNKAYDLAISLLDSTNELCSSYSGANGSTVKARIAEDVQDYVKYGLNFNMQLVANCSLREDFLGKIQDHLGELSKGLAELDTNGKTNKVDAFAKDVALFKQSMFEYTHNCRSSRARSRSRSYSKDLMDRDVPFDVLTKRHQDKLGFKGDFDDLEDAQKLEVYNSIIEESGRTTLPKVVQPTGARSLSFFWSLGTLVASAAILVWDIFTVEQEVDKVLDNSLSIFREVTSFAVSLVATAGLKAIMVSTGAGTATMGPIGFLVGLVVGLVIYVASGALFDVIAGSAASKQPNMNGLRVYTAKMPNGMALANRIAHD